ncbi:MAG: hypothetical protein KatS3mg081_1478 [Gemmatimonadales bacterium]|nr:hypothetical protein HRbin33_00695 [bacterium HR33]GIW52123.1 MAG: hypothetical protein KatS3mg081_1478 [Gemmatimonadales bacterium]
MNTTERGLLLVIAGSAFFGGCSAVAVRPHYRPLPGAVTDTLAASPETVIAALGRALEERRVGVKRRSGEEGYLESEWFDLVSLGIAGTQRRGIERVVKLRAFADPVPPSSTELVIEAVYRRTADPSVPDRLEELLVPPGHPADSLVRELLQTLPGNRREP